MARWTGGSGTIHTFGNGTWLENGAGLAGWGDYSGDTHSPPTSLPGEWKSTRGGRRRGTSAVCNITERTSLAPVATVMIAHTI